MKKFLCLTLMLLFCFALISCADTNNDNNSENSNIEESEIQKVDEKFLGAWYTIEGADEHVIIVNNDSTLTLLDGKDEVVVEIAFEDNKFYVKKDNTELSGLSFELKDGKLYRYENDEADDYIYEKFNREVQ